MSPQDPSTNVIAEIKSFMGRELRIPGAADVDSGVPLVQQGVIDSIELVQLVQFLETRYDIPIDDTEVVPSNFRTLTAIAEFVERKRAE